MKKIIARYVVASLAAVLALEGGALLAQQLGASLTVKPSPAFRQFNPQGVCKVYEFTDFACPACKSAWQEMHKLLEEKNGRLSLELKHFPLKMHKWSLDAALAADCAGRQGKFREYGDKLFSEQGTWVYDDKAPETFLRFARELGLKEAAFNYCVNNAGYRKVVERDAAEARRLELNATPTFIVNGTKAVGYKNALAEIEKCLKTTDGK